MVLEGGGVVLVILLSVVRILRYIFYFIYSLRLSKSKALNEKTKFDKLESSTKFHGFLLFGRVQAVFNRTERANRRVQKNS